MCSINGVLSTRRDEGISAVAKSMAQTMRHRGPNEQNVYADDHMALAHNRLSIIDIQGGQQPIYNENHTQLVILNGEIYNFSQLRNDLEKKGHYFNTSSDTEVVMHGYEEWGSQVGLHLDGAFAFAIWDIQKKQLFLCRDRLGEKPLFYTIRDGKLFFASELKAIVSALSSAPPINLDAVTAFFTYKYIPEPITIYQGIYKFPKGSYSLCGLNIDLQIEQYWRLKDHWGSLSKFRNEEQVKKELYRTFMMTVEQQMLADVPVGSFLSGGIDSSIVTAAMSMITGTRIPTFSIGFDSKEFDESKKAQIISRRYNTEHHCEIMRFDTVLSDLDNIILNYDEPFADDSMLASYYVAKMAAKRVKVVLTGDGADEIFGGYTAYTKAIQLEKLMRIPRFGRHAAGAMVAACAQLSQNSRIIGKAERVAALSKVAYNELWPSIRMTFTQAELSKLFLNSQKINFGIQMVKESYGELPPNVTVVDRMLYCDQQTVLNDNMLVKVDRAAMLASLETRAPFLDVKMVELAAAIPSQLKVNGNIKKYILKETFKDLLPEDILNQAKQGFCVPVGNWLYRELREELLRYTDKELLEDQGIFNPAMVMQIVNNHLRQDNYYINESWKAWSIYIFQKWYFGTYKKIGQER